MEEDKKKKRNKKKKNKQNYKVGEDTAAAGAAADALSAFEEQHKSLSNEKNHQDEVVGTAGVDLDPPKHDTNGEEASSIAEEKQHWLHIQAALGESQETIKHFRDQNALHEEKEAGLETKIDQLQNEKESWVKKEAKLEERIDIISNEKASFEVRQEMLEGKIKQLEEEYDLLILKEKSNKETIADMEAEIVKLRLQVGDWEESRNICLQENRRLNDTITGLQAQVLNLERNNTSATRALDEQVKRCTELEVLNTQMEAASAMVQKLIAENAELVEKVDELYVDLGQYKARDWFSSSDTIIKMDETPAVGSNTSTDNISRSSIPVEGRREIIPVQEDSEASPSPSASPTIGVSNSFKSDESGEIVQIPLDENDTVQTEELQSQDKADVPFYDAPLIGAPFRLISFFASYVSGADLVDKK